MTEWQLRLSAYDRQVHAFDSGQREDFWEALCSHTVPANFMAECPEKQPSCLPCLIKIGELVATRQEGRRAEIAADVREQLSAFDGDKTFGQ
ncbi:hypothetical protein BBK82_03075 [Lentzea guizhouensis]|uniref:Uncharacterized protein n=1 Tax=Lentzea guizhouensis TaxID=1586287 RepID=A0A1B2HBU7_9PSEU|nr:hypothetical protein [Lentzea guizhouensis]ANZ35201.1 hypothetical protein BBK82_03075 [Lentzea guizhouensis]